VGEVAALHYLNKNVHLSETAHRSLFDNLDICCKYPSIYSNLPFANLMRGQDDVAAKYFKEGAKNIQTSTEGRNILITGGAKNLGGLI
jgi:hypothetical protein